MAVLFEGGATWVFTDYRKENPVVIQPDNMFGIDIEDISDDRIDDTLDKLSETGASWIRVYAMWSFIEPNPPDVSYADGSWGNFTGRHAYNWDHLDKIVNGARERGINVYLTNIWPPQWANGRTSDTCNPFTGGDLSCGDVILNSHWFTDFVYNEVSHFVGRVQYYGLWNEPNDRHSFNGPSDTVYLNVFMDTYAFGAKSALLAADPSAKLVGPELSMGTGIPSERGAWDKSWLEPILKRWPDIFDVLSVHNHSNSHNDAKGKAEKVKDLMARYGVYREFWMTEFGVDSCDVELGAQAYQLERVYADTMNRNWWTKTFYYDFVDHDGKDCGAGLFTAFDRDFFPKPAFWAYQSVTGRLPK